MFFLKRSPTHLFFETEFIATERGVIFRFFKQSRAVLAICTRDDMIAKTKTVISSIVAVYTNQYGVKVALFKPNAIAFRDNALIFR